MTSPSKRENAVKPSTMKPDVSVEPVPSAAASSGASQRAEDRRNWIATRAYGKAEERGFAPGREIDDWLKAAAEFDAWEEY
jgi:hypothetical protein